jgi:glycosyltransferase involved in cell wall biosynthesis
MMTNFEQNFLSFIVLSYNQEEYIEDALNSVINQDYKNYEIIISDDASIDKTSNIIQNIIDDHNSKEIYFNRNITNIGIVSNFTKALSMAKGKWIICMGGDDIAHLDRLSYTNQLINQNKNIYGISCAFETISKTGKSLPFLESYHVNSNIFTLPYYKAPSAAIHRDCFERFEPISQETFSEDTIYSMRAFLLGGICISDKIVTKRRIHDNNTSASTDDTSYGSFEKKIKCYNDVFGALTQAKLDTIQIINDKEKQRKIIELINKESERRIKMIGELEAIRNFLHKKETSNDKKQVQKYSFRKIKFKVKLLINESKILAFIKYQTYTRIKLLTYSKKDLIDQKIITIDFFLSQNGSTEPGL